MNCRVFHFRSKYSAELCIIYLHNTLVKLSAKIYRSASWNHLAYWHLFFLIIRSLPYSSLIFSGLPSCYHVLQKFNVGRCLPTVPYLLPYPILHRHSMCFSVLSCRYVFSFFIFSYSHLSSMLPYPALFASHTHPTLACPTVPYTTIIKW